MKVLLIGKNPGMLERLKAELGGRGITVEGTTDMVRASERFDARDFDLVALGGGLDDERRARLKGDFERQHRGVIVDVFAPVAVEQIVQRLSGSQGQRDLASHFEVRKEHAGYDLYIEVVNDADLCVQVYHLGDALEVTATVERRVQRGPVDVRIDAADVRSGVNMILATLDGREFHFQRIEHAGDRHA